MSSTKNINSKESTEPNQDNFWSAFESDEKVDDSNLGKKKQKANKKHSDNDLSDKELKAKSNALLTLSTPGMSQRWERASEDDNDDDMNSKKSNQSNNSFSKDDDDFVAESDEVGAQHMVGISPSVPAKTRYGKKETPKERKRAAERKLRDGVALMAQTKAAPRDQVPATSPADNDQSPQTSQRDVDHSDSNDIYVVNTSSIAAEVQPDNEIVQNRESTNATNASAPGAHRVPGVGINYAGFEDSSSIGFHDDAEDKAADDSTSLRDGLQEDAPIMLTALPVDEEAERAQQREVEDLRAKDLEHNREVERLHLEHKIEVERLRTENKAMQDQINLAPVAQILDDGGENRNNARGRCTKFFCIVCNSWERIFCFGCLFLVATVFAVLMNFVIMDAEPTGSTPSPEPTGSIGTTGAPSDDPSIDPTVSPSKEASVGPTLSPSKEPSGSPSKVLSGAPSTSGSPSKVPSGAPSIAPSTRGDLLLMMLSNISDPVLLLDNITPQGMAYEWVLGDEFTQENFLYETLLERYVYAVFYYCMNGDGWTFAFRWLSSSYTICDWFGVSCATSSHGVELGLGKCKYVSSPFVLKIEVMFD